MSQFTDQRVFAAAAYDVYKVYGREDSEVRALDGVTVGFEAGRFTAIMGPSGSGKSTLMQCVAGLDSLSSGRVFIGQTEITAMNATELTLLRREKIGFIFQGFNLVPALTARENILLPMTLSNRPVDPAFFDEVVAAVGLGDRLGHKPRELSGGQQQRVAVARALISRPELVFADEPTGNLDSRSGGEILGFLRRAVDQWSQTVVMVTHDPAAAAYADLVIFLADGRVTDHLESPTAAAILDRMKNFGS